MRSTEPVSTPKLEAVRSPSSMVTRELDDASTPTWTASCDVPPSESAMSLILSLRDPLNLRGELVELLVDVGALPSRASPMSSDGQPASGPEC